MEPPKKETLCLFCFDEEFAGSQVEEYKGLFPCECRFSAHPDCLVFWTISQENDYECPICRSFLELDPENHQEQEEFPDAGRIFLPHQPVKKIMGVYFLCLLIFYLFLRFMI